jgi:hypothetical protein
MSSNKSINLSIFLCFYLSPRNNSMGLQSPKRQLVLIKNTMSGE